MENRDMALDFAKTIAITYWNNYKPNYERNMISRQDLIHIAYVETLELLNKVKDKKLTSKQLRGYISMKVGKTKLNRLRQACDREPYLVPLDKFAPLDDEINPHEYLVDEKTYPNKVYMRIMSSLDEPIASMFKDYFKDNLTYAEIGKKYHFTADQIRRKIKNVLVNVRKNSISYGLTK